MLSSRHFYLSTLLVVLLCFFVFSDVLLANSPSPKDAIRRQVFYVEPGLMFWTLITFLTLLVVLKTLAWEPIISGLKNREDRIRKDLERAEQAWKNAEEKAKALSERLEQAKVEALAIIEEGRADAHKLRATLLEEAEKESLLVRDRAKKEIELAKKQALQEIWDQTSELATAVAAKILEKELSAQDHQDLVRNYIKEFNKLSV